MKRFKKILFVNDGKTKREMPLERAVNLAKTNQALLTVVEVLEEIPNELQASIELGDIKDFEKIAVQRCTERLGNLKRPLRNKGSR